MTPTEKELFEERAAIMEFDGGMTRVEAERKAKALLSTDCTDDTDKETQRRGYAT